MTCRHAENWMQTGLDGRLTPPERAALDAHLAACPACQTAWREYRALARISTAWARAAGTNDGGDAFTAAVLSRLAAPRPMPVSPFGWPAWGVGSFAALLALAVVWFWPGVAVAPIPTAFLPVPGDAATLPGWLAQTFAALPRAVSALPPAAPTLSPLWTGPLLLAAALVNILCFRRAGGRLAR